MTTTEITVTVTRKFARTLTTEGAVVLAQSHWNTLLDLLTRDQRAALGTAGVKYHTLVAH